MNLKKARELEAALKKSTPLPGAGPAASGVGTQGGAIAEAAPAAEKQVSILSYLLPLR